MSSDFNVEQYLENWTFGAPDQESIKDLKIILMHVPKTGGQSMNEFFRNMVGKKNFHSVSRSARLNHEGAKNELGRQTLDNVPRDILDTKKVFTGFFDYGEHRHFAENCFYVGVVRDPIDRWISRYNYYWNFILPSGKPRGSAGNRANFLSWFEKKSKYVGNKFQRSNVDAFNFQITPLTGESSLESAVKTLDKHYLFICSTKQVTKMQDIILRFFAKRPGFFAKKRGHTIHKNTSNHSKVSDDEKQEMKCKYGHLFATETEFVSLVEKRFEKQFGIMEKQGL